MGGIIETMNETFASLWVYILRIIPGIALGILLLLFARPSKIARVAIYLMFFILMRDALTPLGLWSLGTEGFLWIRLHDDPLFLILFGLASGLLTTTVFFFDRGNREFFRWLRGNPLIGLLIGLAGALLVVSPFFAFYSGVPLADRGGSVAAQLILPIFVFALLGNLLEEGLFRGYVLGHLETKMGSSRAGIVSGIVFAFCHIFLAITVTDIGLPLLLFTLWEGVIAGLIGARFGVIPAAVAHGGAIFLLSSGII
jgi:uncharacterized protein